MERRSSSPFIAAIVAVVLLLPLHTESVEPPPQAGLVGPCVLSPAPAKVANLSCLAVPDYYFDDSRAANDILDQFSVYSTFQSRGGLAAAQECCANCRLSEGCLSWDTFWSPGDLLCELYVACPPSLLPRPAAAPLGAFYVGFVGGVWPSFQPMVPSTPQAPTLIKKNFTQAAGSKSPTPPPTKAQAAEPGTPNKMRRFPPPSQTPRPRLSPPLTSGRPPASPRSAPRVVKSPPPRSALTGLPPPKSIRLPPPKSTTPPTPKSTRPPAPKSTLPPPPKSTRPPPPKSTRPPPPKSTLPPPRKSTRPPPPKSTRPPPPKLTLPPPPKSTRPPPPKSTRPPPPKLTRPPPPKSTRPPPPKSTRPPPPKSTRPPPPKSTRPPPPKLTRPPSPKSIRPPPPKLTRPPPPKATRPPPSKSTPRPPTKSTPRPPTKSNGPPRPKSTQPPQPKSTRPPPLKVPRPLPPNSPQQPVRRAPPSKTMAPQAPSPARKSMPPAGLSVPPMAQRQPSIRTASQPPIVNATADFAACKSSYWKQPSRFGCWPTSIQPSTPLRSIFSSCGALISQKFPANSTAITALKTSSTTPKSLRGITRDGVTAYLNAVGLKYLLTPGAVVSMFCTAIQATGQPRATARAGLRVPSALDCPLRKKC